MAFATSSLADPSKNGLKSTTDIPWASPSSTADMLHRRKRTASDSGPFQDPGAATTAASGKLVMSPYGYYSQHVPTPRLPIARVSKKRAAVKTELYHLMTNKYPSDQAVRVTFTDQQVRTIRFLAKVMVQVVTAQCRLPVVGAQPASLALRLPYQDNWNLSRAYTNLLSPLGRRLGTY